jgi:hypothetical protein
MNQIYTKIIQFIIFGLKERVFLYKFQRYIDSLHDDNILEKLSRKFYLLWVFFVLLTISLIVLTFHFNIPILFCLLSLEQCLTNTRKLVIIYAKIIV